MVLSKPALLYKKTRLVLVAVWFWLYGRPSDPNNNVFAAAWSHILSILHSAEEKHMLYKYSSGHPTWILLVCLCFAGFLFSSFSSQLHQVFISYSLILGKHSKIPRCWYIKWRRPVKGIQKFGNFTVQHFSGTFPTFPTFLGFVPISNMLKLTLNKKNIK